MMDTIQLSKDGAKNEIVEFESGTADMETAVQKIVIANDADYGQATDLLKKVKDRIKELDAKRKEMVKIPNEYVDWVNDQFRPLTAKGEAIKRCIEGKITAYAAEQRKIAEELERIRREEEAARLAIQQKRMEELAQKTNNEKILEQAIVVEEKREQLAAAPVEIKTQAVKTATSSTNIRQQWTFEIVDAPQVPRKYCVPDKTLINAAIKLGERDIPGLRVFQKDIVVSR